MSKDVEVQKTVTGRMDGRTDTWMDRGGPGRTDITIPKYLHFQCFLLQ